MWWDIISLYSNSQEPGFEQFDAACLEVMRMIRDLGADACLESALHGLGHWAHAYPEQVKATIDTRLARHQGLPEALRAYALYVRVQ